MSRGGYRRRHVPPILSPQQVRRAAAQLAAGRLLKQIYLDLGVDRSTLLRALTGHGGYAGVLPGPVYGRCGGRPILSPKKVRRAIALRRAKRTYRQIAQALDVSFNTVRAAVRGQGAYAGMLGPKP